MLTNALETAWHETRHIIPNAIAGPIDHHIFFLHIQKCGGTSVDRAIRRLYRTANPNQPYIEHLDPGAAYRGSKDADMQMWAYRELLAHYFMQKDTRRYITGHFQVSDELLDAHADDFQFVTLLREPVSKWFSHYFFNRYKDDPRGRIELDLDEYLDTPRAHDVGCDYVQLLTGTGDADPDHARDPQLLQSAVDNLDRFDLVGVLDEIDAFPQRFADQFGAPLTILHRNRGPVTQQQRREQITPAIRRRVEEICQPNLEVYNAIASTPADHSTE